MFGVILFNIYFEPNLYVWIPRAANPKVKQIVKVSNFMISLQIGVGIIEYTGIYRYISAG